MPKIVHMFVIVGFGFAAVCASGTDAVARTSARAAAKEPASTTPRLHVPTSLVAMWQPLYPRDRDATYRRSELRALLKKHRKKRFSAACKGAESLRSRLMKQASALFYKHRRKNADVGAIERFIERYVQGKVPLLSIAGEVFAPSAAFRRLAVDACVRANRPELADRFLAQAAGAGVDRQLRLALAAVRLQRDGRPTAVLWLVGKEGGGARAALFRALAAKGPERARHIKNASEVATSSELALLDAFGRWLDKR